MWYLWFCLGSLKKSNSWDNVRVDENIIVSGSYKFGVGGRRLISCGVGYGYLRNLVNTEINWDSIKRREIRGLFKKFVQYVYKNFILQIFGYINVVPLKIPPIRHNTLVSPPFPLLEAPLEFLSS